jgi:hypothetical protein
MASKMIALERRELLTERGGFSVTYQGVISRTMRLNLIHA